MKNIKEYEIDVVGDTQGLIGAIPANHRIVVVGAQYYHNSMDDIWMLKMDVCTFEDGTYTQLVVNDNMPDSAVVVELGANLPSSGLKTTVKNQMNILLDGFSNVGSGNYTEDPA